MIRSKSTIHTNKKLALLTYSAIAIFAISGCEGTRQPSVPNTQSANIEASSEEESYITKIVESPEIFQKIALALWDGRPSLGGIWVAHPDVKNPERVIIKNQHNQQSVIGALFRRERNNPGPPFQLSSDAAESIDVIAGQPITLNVIALRNKKITLKKTTNTPASKKISQLDNDGTKAGVKPISKSTDIKIKPKLTEKKPATTKPPATQSQIKTMAQLPAGTYVQLGLFRINANAKAAVQQMKRRNINAYMIKTTLKNTPIWRVLAGPAQNSDAKKTLLAITRSLGYTDAFYVKK